MTKLFLTTLAKAIATICLVVAVVNTAFAQETSYSSLNIPGTNDYINTRIDSNTGNTLLAATIELTCVIPQGYAYKDTKISVNADGRDYCGIVVQTVTTPKITYILSLNPKIINIYDINRLHLKIVEQ